MRSVQPSAFCSVIPDGLFALLAEPRVMRAGKRLHPLHIGARARAGELHEHAQSLTSFVNYANTFLATKCHYNTFIARTQ